MGADGARGSARDTGEEATGAPLPANDPPAGPAPPVSVARPGHDLAALGSAPANDDPGGRALGRRPPELWGGLECTVVRTAAGWRDQFRETGHHDRIADLEAVAGLGIRTLRYPVSWERVAPDDPAGSNWAWHDERMAELRRLGIRPILGLVHHGGGPAWTGLHDPRFPGRLRGKAAASAAPTPGWVA